MKELLLKQMEFEYWANREILSSMKQARPLHERAVLLFSHIQSVNRNWLDRVQGEQASMAMFQERTLAECEILLHQTHSGWIAYLENTDLEVLDGKISFHLPLDGTTRTLDRKDAIFHITNHSSYHRGQIITLLKGSVADLPMLGYLFFASEIS
jgi:uncharacterized damage-inducible protein DinB